MLRYDLMVVVVAVVFVLASAKRLSLPKEKNPTVRFILGIFFYYHSTSLFSTCSTSTWFQVFCVAWIQDEWNKNEEIERDRERKRNADKEKEASYYFSSHCFRWIYSHVQITKPPKTICVCVCVCVCVRVKREVHQHFRNIPMLLMAVLHSAYNQIHTTHTQTQTRAYIDKKKAEKNDLYNFIRVFLAFVFPTIFWRRFLLWMEQTRGPQNA